MLLTGEGAKKSPNIMVFVIPTVIQRMDKVAVGLKELLKVLFVTALIDVFTFFAYFTLYTLETRFTKTLVDVSIPHLQKALHSLFNAGVAGCDCPPCCDGVILGEHISLVGVLVVGAILLVLSLNESAGRPKEFFLAQGI